MPCQNGGENLGHRRMVGQVRRKGHGNATPVTDWRGKGGKPIAITGNQGDAIALIGKSTRHDRTDAGSGTGDDDKRRGHGRLPVHDRVTPCNLGLPAGLSIRYLE